MEVEPARSRDAADGGSEAADARAPEDGPVGLPRETPEAIVEAFTVVERWIGAPTEARDGAPEVPALAAEPEQPAPLPQVPSVPAGDGAESVHEAERDAPDAAERPHPSPRLTIGAIHVEIVEREPEKRRRAEAPRARQPAAPVQRVPRESRPLRPFGWRQR